ncbi:MAG: filamentous hemagglutinin N-terminal domain-containing protein, partial [Candidatus Omnitrophica bacterium]|nr:filamentous hemagglutinin N-terminal domain-containing protein [Candidatus Omnitrophota bacterium]
FLSFLLLLCGPQGIALALPEGGVVVAGSATFTQPSASTMNINTSDKVAINYNSFNINTAETVNFIQPSSSSIALNRVVGVDPSSILGSLNANGQVFLINPNGIIFGPGANINVHGLVASTLDITNQNFLSSNFKFVQDPAKALGAISNLGVITATGGGYAVLAAPSVSNSGVIQANLGTIALGSTEGFTLSLSADNLISFALDTAVSKQLSSYLDNKGTLKADSGTILVEAKVAEEIVDAVVNNDGLIEANTIVKDREGNIKLTTTTALANSGTIRANASDYTKAGNIEATSGKTLTLAPTSRVEAKGKDIESTGGNVYLYSNKDAIAQAGQTIDISGGTVSGDGGWAELSSAGNMQLGGQFFGSAQTGYSKGKFFFDPTLLEITGTTNTHGADFSVSADSIVHRTGSSVLTEGGDFYGYATGTDPGWGDYTVETGASINAGTDGNILIYANGDIKIWGDLTTTSATPNNGRINLMPWSTGDGSIYIYDGADILINGAGGNANVWFGVIGGDAVQTINLEGGTVTNTGEGGIYMFADEGINLNGTDITCQGGTNGFIDLHPNFDYDAEHILSQPYHGDITMTAGTVTLNSGSWNIYFGGSNYRWGEGMQLLGGSIVTHGGGFLAFSYGDITLGGTNVNVNGQVEILPGFHDPWGTLYDGDIIHTAGILHSDAGIYLGTDLYPVNDINLAGSGISGQWIRAYADNDIDVDEALVASGGILRLQALAGDIRLTSTASLTASGGNVDLRAVGDAYITGISVSGGNVYVEANEIFDAGDFYPLDISVGSNNSLDIASRITLISSSTNDWPENRMYRGAYWEGIGTSSMPLEIFSDPPPFVVDPTKETEERKEQKKIGQTITQFKCATIRLR